MTQIIGRGERTALKILKTVFPNADIRIQQSIRYFISEEAWSIYNEIFKKATIDIGMSHKGKFHAIRIQDNHHTGDKTSTKDAEQKRDMQKNGVIVIDIHERDAPNLFKEQWNYKSFYQVLEPLYKAKVRI
jgi:hypothetical protein